jgi:hypothetical protein
VSVLGPINIQKDDWFFSDFCLLWKILGGTAKSEHWLTGIDLHESTAALGRPIRHGPPGNVKTVFDDNSDSFYTAVAPSVLAETFLNHIQQAASSASKGDWIIIVVVAHGSQQGEVAIGKDELGHLALVMREDIEARLTFAHEDIKTTIISTACFSGMWLLPLPTPTKASDVLAAVSRKDVSYSLPVSLSSHYNGGEFASALASHFAGLAALAIPRDSKVHGVNCEKTVTEAPAIVETIDGQQIIKRAISVGDIITTSAVDRSLTIGVWAQSL